MTNDRQYQVLLDYYNTNVEFKEYVDKYCTKHSKTCEEALHDKIILDYFNYLLQKE